MKNKDIIILVLFIIILYLIHCDNNKNKRINHIEEKFSGTTSSLTEEERKNSYAQSIIDEFNKNIGIRIDTYLGQRKDIPITESIKNLGIIANKLQNNNGTMVIPSHIDVEGKLNIKNNLNVNGNINFLPAGCIIMWGTEEIPDGWVRCDGKYYLRNEFKNCDNPPCPDFNDINDINDKDKDNYIYAPDLRGRFVIGEGQARGYNNNETRKHSGSTEFSTKYVLKGVGGWEQHKLTIDEIPSHNHDHDIHRSSNDSCGSSNTFDCGAGGSKSGVKISSTGGDEPHNNMPPYYVLIYIMKI